MKFFCPKCGTSYEDNMKFCFNCGFDLSKAKEETSDQEESVAENTIRVNVAETPETSLCSEPATCAMQTSVPAKKVATAEVSPVQNKVASPVKEVKKAEKKAKKKHKLPWLIRFIIANIIIAGVLFGLWFSFGNMITLYFHSEDVVQTLNSGSLDLQGTENAYDELPNYIKEMLDEKYFENDYGPITKSVLPYIHVERESINGWFGASTVTYRITAPDLEVWLLNIDPVSVTDENQLLRMLDEYVMDAPKRTTVVEVSYARSHIFAIEWTGDYFTPEFTNAVCGGFNSGYNTIYQRAMDELNKVMFGEEGAE